MQFSGFVQGTRATAVPDPLFGLLLEQIQDLAELKVVLRGVWLRNQKKGSLRPLFRQEFLADPVLLRGLAETGVSAEERILRGLELAVHHGVFLHCQDGNGQPGTNTHGGFYLLNTYQDRQALAQRGLSVGDSLLSEARLELTEPPAGERPNIFALYEDNIGTIGPLIAEQLKEAEVQYPEAWIAEAFGIAIAHNVRNLAYIEAILRRWAAEGKDHGEPGGHSPPDNYQKHLEDYQRRWGISTDERT